MILNSFIKDIDEIIAEMLRDIGSKDITKLKNSIHTLKGLSATIGALKLRDSSVVFEEQIRNNDLTNKDRLINQILSDIVEIKTYINNFDYSVL